MKLKSTKEINLSPWSFGHQINAIPASAEAPSIPEAILSALAVPRNQSPCLGYAGGRLPCRFHRRWLPYHHCSTSTLERFRSRTNFSCYSRKQSEPEAKGALRSLVAVAVAMGFVFSCRVRVTSCTRRRRHLLDNKRRCNAAFPYAFSCAAAARLVDIFLGVVLLFNESIQLRTKYFSYDNVRQKRNFFVFNKNQPRYPN